MDIFEKCFNFTDAKEAIKAGIYPYFHALESGQDTEVVMHGRRTIMIGSNNYLGLTSDERVKEVVIKAVEKYGTGCSGSRFLNGTLDLHLKLEENLASFLNKDSALTFSTGFQSNLGIISAVASRNDYIICDNQNHASIIDASRLSFAKTVKYEHNDMQDLEEEAFSQLNTNFFGVHRMCRQVLPIMRKQKSGMIINISSVAGLISIPFQSMYSASKYAVEAMSEALRLEVKSFGIKVVLVEPGDINTGFTDSRQFSISAKDSAYKEKFTKSVNTMIKDEVNGPGPEVVAKVITRVIEMNNPPIRKVVGFQYKTFVLLKRLLPSRFVEYVLAKLY